MSELLQSGHHPDADRLNAFVEHVLPSHEHEETLAHLSICPNCRAVVALSVPPFEETLPQPAPVRGPWSRWRLLSGLRLLWPLGTAAALAALVAIGIHIRNVSIRLIDTISPQVAANHAPPPRQAQQPQASESKQRKAISPQITKPVSKPAPPPKIAKPAETGAFDELPLEARTATPKSMPGLPAVSSPARANGTALGIISANGAITKRGLYAASPSPQSAPSTNSAFAGSASAAAPPAAAPQAAPPLGFVANQAATSPLILRPMTTATQMPPATDLAQAILSEHPLPSGLPPLSIVMSPRQRILAVDTHGELFLSDDFGAHWNPVLAPWPGRAVKVNLSFSSSSHGAKMFSSSPARSSHFAPQANTVGGPLALSSGVASPSLSGTVTDTTGAIIPGATVIVSASPTQLAHLAKTDTTGHYVIDNLPAGTYVVEADARGFNKQQVAGVAVAPDKPALANLSLQVGAASETVTISATASNVDSPVPLDEKKAAPAAKIEPPPSTFEITTDTGERWVSTDGQTWRRE